MADVENSQPPALSAEQAAAILGSTPVVLQAEFASLPADLLRWRPEPDG